MNQINDRILIEIEKEQHKKKMKSISKKIENNYIDMDSIIQYFEKYYVEGDRNHLVLALGGMLSHKGYSKEESEDILLEILDSIGEEDFNERKEQIKYSFNSENPVGIRPWLKEVFYNISNEDELETKYQEFKSMFELPQNRFIQISSGKFYVEEYGDSCLIKFVEKETETVSSRVKDKLFNLNRFKRFVKENEINLGEIEPKEIYTKICKLDKLVRLNKADINNIKDSFFEDNELLENNQLIYNGKLAYTMCNGFNTMLVTFDNIEIIDDDIRFKKYPKIKSNLLTSRGKKKLDNKEVNENIFEDLKALLLKYVDLPENDLNIVLFYIFHTYLFNIQGNTVYLYFVGMPGTGKSSILKFLELVTWNGQFVCNLSQSSLFREVDVLQQTLNLDEVDKLGDDGYSSIQGLIHNGYSKGGSVKRTEKNSENGFSVKEFRVFCPKTFTSNSPIFVDSFKSRCIEIVPQRTNRFLYPINMIGDEGLKKFADIRDDIYIYMLKYGMEIFRIFKDEVENPERMSNRKNELISVLNCFNIHFKKSIDINKILNKREEFLHPYQDHYYLIMEILAESIRDDFCIIKPEELSKKMNKKLHGKNLIRYEISSISAGMKMTNLGFSDYKTKDKINGYHYDIPKRLIESKIAIYGYDIKLQ